MKSTLIIAGILTAASTTVSTVAIGASPGEVVNVPTTQKDIREFKQSCEQTRRQAVSQCRSEYDSSVSQIFRSGTKSPDTKADQTIRRLCELEAERDYDYCRVAASFQHTNIAEVVTQEGAQLQPILTKAQESDEITPLLSGSNYRTLAMLCFQMPGGDSVLNTWGGVNLMQSCDNDLWEACMNDPDMGSNQAGTAPHPDHTSEREQNCMEAIYMWDIPVL